MHETTLQLSLFAKSLLRNATAEMLLKKKHVFIIAAQTFSPSAHLPSVQCRNTFWQKV
jgi:hypothetical protein